MKTIAVIELGLMDKMVPLVGGYLEAYAGCDPWLKSSYRFEKHFATPRTDRQTLMRDCLDLQADIYAFSCYVWNTGLIRSLVRDLLVARPGVRVMLGGPQVMDQGHRLLQPPSEHVCVCNGEGEATFADYLRELTQPRPDLSKVPGITFCADGSVITTERRSRLTSMDEIPSPFLSGLFRGQYRMSIVETNRGCPFRCSFCFWGAATNDRVYNFSEERVRDEITWIMKSSIPFLFIADANWGMSKRDVALSRHIADCRRTYYCPKAVYLAGAAKNSPGRVGEIVDIFDQAGIFTTQPISLQTLDDHTLKVIDRQNIKKRAFIQVQERLNERQMSSFTELMWPLPGETLPSFRRGIAELCRLGGNTNTIIVYPHLLLVNTPMHRQQNELGLVTRRIGDGTCESDLVVGTDRVPAADYEDGLRFYYSTLLLYNIRGLRATMAYLDRRGIATYHDVLLDFVRFWSTMQDSAIVAFIEDESIRRLEVGRYNNYGTVVHHALHQHRSEYREMLRRFVSTCPYAADERVRFVFEMDRLLLPYVYSSTPLDVETQQFEFLEVESAGARALRVTVPTAFRPLCADVLAACGRRASDETERYRVDHARHQFPQWTSRGLEADSEYCFAMLLRNERIIPTWVEAAAVAAPAAIGALSS